MTNAADPAHSTTERDASREQTYITYIHTCIYIVHRASPQPISTFVPVLTFIETCM